MNDSANEAPLPARSIAQELALEMGGFSQPPGMPDSFSECLSPAHNALLADVFGLLNGISRGMITVGQPRIQQNLTRIIEELSVEQESHAKMDMLRSLSTVLSRAASAGLTAENQPLANRVLQRSS